MAAAMGRSVANILFGALKGGSTLGAGEASDRPVRSAGPEDVAILLGYAHRVIIVPGYGLAVAQAQHTLRELVDVLGERGIEVDYAIHPVAGRMPGHMNVLLAEAQVPYEQLKEMDDINREFKQTDVVLVVGANDVVNPAAKTTPGAPIYGMPILNADEAQQVVFLKRSMRPGLRRHRERAALRPEDHAAVRRRQGHPRQAAQRRQGALTQTSRNSRVTPAVLARRYTRRAGGIPRICAVTRGGHHAMPDDENNPYGRPDGAPLRRPRVRRGPQLQELGLPRSSGILRRSWLMVPDRHRRRSPDLQTSERCTARSADHAVQPVAGVAEPGHDVALLVEPLVHPRGHDGDRDVEARRAPSRAARSPRAPTAGRSR